MAKTFLDCAAMFLTEDMLAARMSDFFTYLITTDTLKLEVAAVFPDSIGDRIINLETQTANMAAIISKVPDGDT